MIRPLALIALLCACAVPRRALPYSPAERVAAESRALSQLAAVEAALAGYAKDRGRPPAHLWELAPRYLAQIPLLDLGSSFHPPTNKARDYAPGEAPRDTGAWGYDPQKPRVFIDCTHLNSRERPWHAETGVY